MNYSGRELDSFHRADRHLHEGHYGIIKRMKLSPEIVAHLFEIHRENWEQARLEFEGASAHWDEIKECLGRIDSDL